MKETYLELMELSLSAYSKAHILRFFSDVKTNGLTEHGFPRLTANIGILIAHGRRTDLLPIFLEMMDFCCEQIPLVLAANDFSIREIVCCIFEIEKVGAVDAARIQKWKAALATCDPNTCYDRIAKSLTDPVRNWALFSGVSEYYRQALGLCQSTEFIELQFGQQLQWFDENGMYGDNPHAYAHQPVLYDLAPRFLYALALHLGYRGRYYEKIDALLKKAGLHTLAMQSVTGEIAFGGRSNQFYFNEGLLCGVLEFEASRYAKEGNMELAGRFKAAIQRAVSHSLRGLSAKPIYHIKNRFPTETKYGCEDYAYFDKYMITVASNYYGAYRMCDDTIPVGEFDGSPVAWQTSPRFHKVFLRAGGYALEFDTDADAHYDASGLGRVQKEGAPSTVCMATPCPGHPIYTVDTKEPLALSLATGVWQDEKWLFATSEDTAYEVSALSCGETKASAKMRCRFKNGGVTESRYTVSESGVLIEIEGAGRIANMLPAFAFDGACETSIVCTENTLEITYKGWLCRYTTNGKIVDLEKTAQNRNGYYRAFAAIGNGQLTVHVEILPCCG